MKNKTFVVIMLCLFKTAETLICKSNEMNNIISKFYQEDILELKANILKSNKSNTLNLLYSSITESEESL